MTVEIELGGRRSVVEVRQAGQEWTAAVDGRSLTVTMAAAGDRWSVLAGVRSYDVAFEPRGGGELVVHVNGEAIPLAIVDPRRRLRRGGHEGASAEAGPAAVKAPMPGRVVRVLVRPGEAIAARQGVAVIEAMKMENELRAPRAGTVAEVRVTEGASVEAGAVLVVVE